MTRSTDVQPQGVSLYFLPVKSRRPVKFGHQISTQVTYARTRMQVVDRAGRAAEGWGETPLNVEWAWPSHLAYEPRLRAMKGLAEKLAAAWSGRPGWGHSLELGYDFLEQVLPGLVEEQNRESGLAEPMPLLAALVCASAFDLALHDAFGTLHRRPTYSTYNAEFLGRDLGAFFGDGEAACPCLVERYPEDFLVTPPANRLAAWHLVAGLDPIEVSEIDPGLTDDDYPTALTDWIRRDGLTCLKVKLRGNDADWDYRRLERVGLVGRPLGVRWLTADFNCTVTEPAYVNEILDRLLVEQPALYQMLLYVEQPFPYDLEAHPIDVRSVAARKPLFMDESADDWRSVERGRDLGWSGVALKTCKTQTGAILSLCWAKAHGMPLMVQDLSNAMMAQISHAQLAAHAGTIMGVETNGCQFYPAASQPEGRVHPGLYRRRKGQLDLSTIGTTGLGYRVDEIDRTLPEPATRFER